MSKKLEFQSKMVSIDEQDDAYIVSLADDAMEPEHYIILQRSTNDEEQDNDLGLGTYFLEVCGSNGSGYGGIKSAELRRDQLELTLVQPNDYLDGVEKIVVRFQLPKQKRDALAKQLALIFRDSDCVLRVA